MPDNKDSSWDFGQVYVKAICQLCSSLCGWNISLDTTSIFCMISIYQAQGKESEFSTFTGSIHPGLMESR